MPHIDGSAAPAMDARPTRRARHRRRRSVAALAPLLAFAVLAGACGEGRSDDAAPADPATDATSEVEGERFGDLPSPCGPGDARGATDQGVTDSAVTIGYGDDAGYQPAPGLSGELSDAMVAMIEWCNDQGGINGREVVGNYYDAKVTEVTNAMTAACAEVFMLVGQGWVADSAQEGTRRSCGLPSVPGYAVSPAFSNAPNMISPVPNPVDRAPVHMAAAMAELFPEEVKRTAVVYADYPATRDPKDKVLATYGAFGFEFLDCPVTYGIAGESDWRPLAQKLQQCGAEVVYFAGSPYPNFQNFLGAADQVGYEPIWFSDANMYDETLAQWNVDGHGDNVYVRSSFVPLFEADRVPAVQQYIDLVTASGGEANQLGQQAASAFLLWATAAQACGSELTRACVMEQLGEVTSWTGGGMHAAGNPAENLPTDCGMVLKLEGTRFVRVVPEAPGEMDCDPRYVAEVTGPVVDQAGLDADRIAQAG